MRPDEPSQFADAMRHLSETLRRAGEQMERFNQWGTLLSLGLDDWNDEMDNCYLNFDDDGGVS